MCVRCAQFDKWSTSQRLAVIEDLVQLCRRHQLQRLSDVMYQQKLAPVRDDFTFSLPRCLSLRIFSFLDPRSLCRCAQVSRTDLPLRMLRASKPLILVFGHCCLRLLLFFVGPQTAVLRSVAWICRCKCRGPQNPSSWYFGHCCLRLLLFVVGPQTQIIGGPGPCVD